MHFVQKKNLSKHNKAKVDVTLVIKLIFKCMLWSPSIASNSYLITVLTVHDKLKTQLFHWQQLFNKNNGCSYLFGRYISQLQKQCFTFSTHKIRYTTGEKSTFITLTEINMYPLKSFNFQLLPCLTISSPLILSILLVNLPQLENPWTYCQKKKKGTIKLLLVYNH